MFRQARRFNGSLAGWDVSSVRVMDGMFAEATSFNGSLEGWDVSHVASCKGMLRGSGFGQPLPLGDAEVWRHVHGR
eukprot:gene22377-biopygen12455